MKLGEFTRRVQQQNPGELSSLLRNLEDPVTNIYKPYLILYQIKNLGQICSPDVDKSKRLYNMKDIPRIPIRNSLLQI